MTSSFPFVFRDGIYAKYAKRNRVGTIKNIRALFEKHFLDEIDTEILLHLQKYVYLNAFLIRTLLGRSLEKCTPEFCKTRLKKLERMGFIVRFQFFYQDDNNIEHATPFVYNLSEAGRRIFPIKDDKSFDITMDIDCVQRRLSYNQFHIMLENQYGSALTYSSYLFGNEYDGLYKLQSNNMPLIFYVFSIRSGHEWEKNYLKRLRKFKASICDTGLSYSGLIVICENEYQSLRAERCRSGDSSLLDIDIYYICDYAAVAEGAILHNLIIARPENNYESYDIIKLNVDGHVKANVVNVSE